MLKSYFDPVIFSNPLLEYAKWLVGKIHNQTKYWGSHLRINYQSFARNTAFGKYNWIGKYCELVNCNVGSFTYFGDYCMINNATFGKFCSVGPNVRMGPGKHPTSGFVSTHPSTFNNQPNLVRNFVTENQFVNYEAITIGNDVWIGANCLIVDGVTIGNGAVIAANSVVAKNVSDYDIVGGVPAKLIRKRFDENQIEFLLQSRWWDQSEEWIQQNISSFWSVEGFIKNRGEQQ